MIYPLPLEQLSSLARQHDPLLLFDSARSDAGDRYSYLFLGPREILCAEDWDQLPDLWAGLDRAHGSSWVAGYLCYEAAYGIEDRLAPLRSRTPGFPLAWFGVFEQAHVFDHETGTWSLPLPEPGAEAPPAPAGNGSGIGYAHGIDQAAFQSQVQRIRELIRQGETYQVNLTFDGTVSTGLAGFELYRRLRIEQRVPYAAYIRTGRHCIASFSPELFFRVDGGRRTIRVKPMKGTAARGRTAAEDESCRRRLAADPKNRAENLMIVDLLRSDLGKVCEIGSIRVSDLFAVESHRTVLQMTSTIEGRLRSETTLSGVFKALFPSGSVTGAPKLRSMEIIAGLEEGPRGPYCGAIGFGSAGGDAVFSVPIRTLYRLAGESHWHFRVGSGIVWESEPVLEWQECLTKSAFVTSSSGRFEILETMLLDGELVLADEHRQRMAASARFWGYPFSEDAWSRVTGEIMATSGCEPARVRILLDEHGGLHVHTEPISPEPWPELPAPVTLGRLTAAASDPFLFHKTTYRPWYNPAMAAIRRGEIFDQIFVNASGEVTEGARSNVFVLGAEGVLVTPPVSSGLLPGILRQRLIDAGMCREQVLTPDDLRRAEHLYCGNSVLGLVPVSLRPLRRTDEAISRR
jgi:para-aminobenzoate synthetase/4-amino-4-deoxychorismate lyase